MACKQCYHYEACFKSTNGWITNEVCERCNLFKDKHKIIELPCKVGDIVFLVANGKIKEVLVDRFEINPIGMKIILHNDLCKYLPDEEIFFSKKDAENKLKGGKTNPQHLNNIIP